MTTGAQRFPRTGRLLRRRDFQSIGRVGRRAVGRSFVMLAATGVGGEAVAVKRLGITVSRRIGGAVVRNHVKRRVREWFRTSQDAIPKGLDLVVIARRGAGALGGREIAEGLDELLQRTRAEGT